LEDGGNIEQTDDGKSENGYFFHGVFLFCLVS
jgi:hypothetical protein